MIKLSTWNLSTPVGSPARTIHTAELCGGYQDEYFTSGETLTFWAPVTGSTTANAKYPRSELRETHPDGQPCNWSCDSADHFLRATLHVSQVPPNGKIVIGQIHAHESTRPLLKLEYQYSVSRQTGKIVAKVRTTTDAEVNVVSVADGIALDQRFNYIIRLTPGGTLSVRVGQDQQQFTLDKNTWKDKPLYFKAGVYAQDNQGCDTDGGRATFFELDIEHQQKV